MVPRYPLLLPRPRTRTTIRTRRLCRFSRTSGVLLFRSPTLATRLFRNSIWSLPLSCVERNTRRASQLPPRYALFSLHIFYDTIILNKRRHDHYDFAFPSLGKGEVNMPRLGSTWKLLEVSPFDFPGLYTPHFVDAHGRSMIPCYFCFDLYLDYIHFYPFCIFL